MQIKTEIMNFVTGILLVVSGVLTLVNQQFELGMNWIIFGSMYLVMGDYLQVTTKRNFAEKMLDVGRILFSWIGFIGSVILLVYYCVRFF